MHPMCSDAQDDPKAAHSPHRPCDDKRTALGKLDDCASEKGGVSYCDNCGDPINACLGAEGPDYCRECVHEMLRSA